MKCGALAMRVGRLVGADLLHAQDVDAVLLAAEAEGQEFAAFGGGRRGRLATQACRLVACDDRGVGDHVHAFAPWVTARSGACWIFIGRAGAD
jgi:hypothetical protein